MRAQLEQLQVLCSGDDSNGRIAVHPDKGSGGAKVNGTIAGSSISGTWSESTYSGTLTGSRLVTAR